MTMGIPDHGHIRMHRVSGCTACPEAQHLRKHGISGSTAPKERYKPMTFRAQSVDPTEEQQRARDAFTAGGDLAVVAGAGTGKTTTLVLMAESTRKTGLYLAFNKAIA